jgi:hypothetical protein
LHSYRNVGFELETVRHHLSAGGAMVVDDIDANPAFDAFGKAHRRQSSFIWTAEPLAPDMRRVN